MNKKFTQDKWLDKYMELKKVAEDALLVLEAWQTDFELLANDSSYKPVFNRETIALRDVLRKQHDTASTD